MNTRAATEDVSSKANGPDGTAVFRRRGTWCWLVASLEYITPRCNQCSLFLKYTSNEGVYKEMYSWSGKEPERWSQHVNQRGNSQQMFRYDDEMLDTCSVLAKCANYATWKSTKYGTLLYFNTICWHFVATPFVFFNTSHNLPTMRHRYVFQQHLITVLWSRLRCVHATVNCLVEA